MSFNTDVHFRMALIFLLLFAANVFAWQATFRKVVLENKTLAYNKMESPYDITGKPISLRIHLQTVVLSSIVEAQQLVSYIINSWEDPRLYFESHQLNDSMQIVPSYVLWVPNIDCLNCLDINTMDSEVSFNDVLVWSSFVDTAVVSMNFPARFDTLCSMDTEAFPFDAHECGIKFSVGWASDGRLNLEVAELDIPEILHGTPEWTILPTTSLKDEFSATIRFRLERNPNFYLTMFILPTVIVASLCLAALTLPLKFSKGDKYTMGITGLLGLTFLLGILSQQVPRGEKTPIMGKWLLSEMFFCIIAVIIDEPSRFLKRRLSKRKLPYDRIIDYTAFILVFGGNLLITFVLFVIRP